jgi:hypothetical protein
MKKIKTFKLFEANEFGDTGFKSDINHIKMIMSDIKDDGIDFRVIPGERDFPEEKDNIYIKIFNIPFNLPTTKLDYFDRKYKQLIGEIGDLYHLDTIRVVFDFRLINGIVRSCKSYEEYYKWVSESQQPINITALDFEFSSHDGEDVF